MTLLLPNSELVALAWLAAVPGLSAAMVGTTLPRLPATGALPGWVTTGFVTAAVVGGSPDAWMPQAQPVIAVNCWAVNAAGNGTPGAPINAGTKPPWGKAAQLCEQIRAAAYMLNRSGAVRQVALGVAGYAHAAVQSAVLLSEPRRMPSDPASYARFTFDMQLFWFAEAT